MPKPQACTSYNQNDARILRSKRFALYNFIISWYAFEIVVIPSHVATSSDTVLFPYFPFPRFVPGIRWAKIETFGGKAEPRLLYCQACSYKSQPGTANVQDSWSAFQGNAMLWRRGC